jgi:tRNA(fMet)-specific endonuclease VapC
MRYLLDTNAMIGLLKEAHSRLAERARREDPRSIGLSSIVAHELYYGAFKSQRRGENLARLDAIRFEVLPFDKEDAIAAGEIRAILATAGSPIGPYDVLIAGQARSRGLVLVTDNLREFRRVADLQVENWAGKEA